MSSSPNLYIGLLSGTSLDSIDAALVDLSSQHVNLISTLEYPIAPNLRQRLVKLCQSGNHEIDLLGPTDRELGKAFAQAVNELLRQSDYSHQDVVAVGSHGQTIRHRPEGELGFTLQIGDANTITFETGITTVADFRRRDIAAGGQGAPLAPAFHQAMFSSNLHNRAIVNIGGIANVTYLSADGGSIGFDTGPGNVLLDSWIAKIHNKRYDYCGQWAASGTVIPELLSTLLEHSFFQRPPPKSTGREDFNLDWLRQYIDQCEYDTADIQATLVELTAKSISTTIEKLPNSVDEVYICGGGAYNTQLMLRLETLLHPRLLAKTEQLGISAQWVEAAAFAWLAKQTMEGISGNLPAVTGATSSVILGSIYPK